MKKHKSEVLSLEQGAAKPRAVVWQRRQRGWLTLAFSLQPLALLLAFLLALRLAPAALAQTGQTVTWVGGNSFLSYSDTNNWSPNIVPLNNAGTNFTVIVPENTSLELDIGGPGAIDALALRAGAFLDIWGSNSLTVNNVTLVRGTVEATGAGSGFTAMGSQTVLDTYPSLQAYQGGQINLSASSYSWSKYNNSATLIYAADPGSRVSLTNLSSMSISYGDGGSWTYLIGADSGGVVDLSNLGQVTGPDSDDWLEFRINSSASLRLGKLQQSSGNMRFQINSGSYSLPSLDRATSTQFNVATNSLLDVPALLSFSGGGVSIDPGGSLEADQLLSADNTTINVADTALFNATNLLTLDTVAVNLNGTGTLIATNLAAFRNSDIAMWPGKNLLLGPLTDVYASRLSVTSGSSLHVAATGYSTPWDWEWSPTLLSADGAGSLLDVSLLKSILVYGGYYNAYTYSVSANNNGVVDLSGLETITGPKASDSSWFADDWLVFSAKNRATIKIGASVVSGNVHLTADGTGSKLTAAGLYLKAPTTLSATGKGVLDVEGDFFYENTDSNSIVVEGAYFQMDGATPQRLEVGGQDLGAGGSSSRNFGYSQLIVGNTNQTSVVKLVDTLNNGNRGPGGTPEALYLYGQDGAGLRLLKGSRLLVNGLNAYAMVGGQMRRLNDLIAAGANSVAFDGGFIAQCGGPRITNMTPSVAVTPAVSSVNVSFDQPINPASFTPSAVVITGPSGPVAVSSVTLVSNTTWMISFPAQSADGTYTVRVGPNIDELAGNLHGLDQNGDGLSGDGTNDTFYSAFLIDGTPPAVVSAYGLQYGDHIGLIFTEPVAATFATNPANYVVDGQAASNAVAQVDGSSVALSVAPVVGSAFTLNVSGMADLLGNVTNQQFTGVILPLQPMDIGLSGDPREAGWTVPWSPTDFDVVAGGHDIWNASDAFHFLCEKRSGDFDVQVRFDSYQGTAAVETGIMFREDLTSGSANLYWTDEPGYGLYATWRNSPGGGTSYLQPLSASNLTNTWLRLKRVGSVFAMYEGTNGSDWSLQCSITNSLATSGYLGLATSRNTYDTSTTVLARYRSYSEIGPGIVAQPQSQSVTSGVEVVFGVLARGLPTLAYQWLFNGLPLAGATSNLLVLPSVTLSNAGDYRVVITNAFGSITSDVATLTVDGKGLGGLDGDVSPRPLGNGILSVADWVQVGRFVAGLDTVMNSGEFQRADCAPRATGGNGILSIADWTQAGRYAAGLDPAVPAFGPTEPTNAPPGPLESRAKDISDRKLQVSAGVVPLGIEIETPVLLTADGNENALGFSLTFDAARLTYRGLTLGAATARAYVQVNTQAVASGVFGMAIANATGQSFAPGTFEVARLQFLAGGSAGNTAIAFADKPVFREIVDATAEPLPATYIDGVVQVASGPYIASFELLAGSGVQLSLAGPPGSSGVVETSPDLQHWTPASTNVLGSASVTWIDTRAPRDAQRFYRVVAGP